jgi:hypothetical protein
MGEQIIADNLMGRISYNGYYNGLPPGPVLRRWIDALDARDLHHDRALENGAQLEGRAESRGAP